jgi:hypothetical protein
MRITLLPHALERMELYGISEDAVRSVLAEADEAGQANFGRFYSQKTIGHRKIRVIYNQGADEAVVITVMLRRRDGERS